MKINSIHILACSIATLGTLSLSAFAQDPTATPSASPSASPGDWHPPHHPVPPVFKALDTDGDGTLSAAEIASAPASLKKLDTNGDGQLSPGELRPKPPGKSEASKSKTDRPPMDRPRGPGGPHGHPHGPDPLIRALDTDDDGIISASEIANASASLKTLDKNGDGQITRDELRPQGPPPPPPEEGDGPDNGPMPSPAAQ